MFNRIKAVFWPSKGMAAFGVIGFLVLSIWFFYQGPWLVGFGIGSLLYALWYGFVLAYKLNRDYQLSQPVRPAQTEQPPVIPMSSPESNQFFVPPAHPDER